MFISFVCPLHRDTLGFRRATLDLNGINGSSALFLASNLPHPSDVDKSCVGVEESVWFVLSLWRNINACACVRVCVCVCIYI